MISKIFLTVLGLFYVATGLWCGIRPRQTMEAIGLSTLNGSGNSEYVTVYGGFLVGVGIFLAIAGLNSSYVLAGLVASTAIHAGIIVARGISLGMYSGVQPITYGLAVFEAVIFLASSFLLWLARTNGPFT